MMILVFLTLILFVGAAVDLEHETPPSYIIIASRQRSSSSTLNTVVSSHPCVLHGNEMFFNNPQQDILGAHSYVEMSSEEIGQDPHRFLSTAYNGICEEARKDGTLPDTCEFCTISIKLFDKHNLSKNGLHDLMNDHNMRFIVLERDASEQFCSLKRANHINDWGTIPSRHKNIDIPCSSNEVTQEFHEKNEEWFYTIRSGLRNAGQFFLDIPFKSVASCDLLSITMSIFGFSGLFIPEEVVLQEDMEKLFWGC